MSEESKILFMQITNCDNIQTAAHYLDMCNGNMEQAIQLYYDTSAPQTVEPTNNVNFTNSNDVRAPMNFNTQRLMDFSDDEADNNINDFNSPVRQTNESIIVPNVTYGGFGGIFEEFINHHRQIVADQQAINHLSNASNRTSDESDADHYLESDSESEIIMINSSDNESSDQEEDENLIVLNESSNENSDFDSEEEILTVDSNGDYDLSRGSNKKKESHITKFQKLFAKPSDILYSSSLNLNMIKGIATKKGKWVIVNVQNMNLFESMKLNRDIWSNSEIKLIVNENFVFVQYDHFQQAAKEYMFLYPFDTAIPDSIRRSVEGDRIDNVIIPDKNNEVIDLDIEEEAEIYGDRLELPSIGIIDPVTGALMEAWHGGIKDKSVFLKELEIFVSKYVHNNPDAVDLMRENEKQITPVFDRVEVEKEDQQEIEVANEVDYSEKVLFNSVKPKKHEEPPSNPKTTTRIQFRLFNTGKRVVHRFSKSDTVRSLYEFCKSESENFPTDKHFYLVSAHNTNLINHLDSSLEEMDLLNSSITVEEIMPEDE
ncbi:hypothetical protein QEN19_001147 [Hanseniaspora menglaensis]